MALSETFEVKGAGENIWERGSKDD